MQSQERFLTLLEKYTSNTISAEEHNELLYLISTGKYDQVISKHFETQFRGGNIPGTDIHPQRKQEIINKILGVEKQNSKILPGAFPKKNLFWWAIAACFAGVIACTVYFLPKIYQDGSAGLFTKHLTQGMSEQTNLSAHPLKLKLEDGSLVTLQPGSRLHFPDHFSSTKREVYLEGEAFFEVSRNPNHPFLVYYNNLITHVLGTSFGIKMDKEKKMVEVSVVTGKVQVYENQDLLKPDNNKKTNGVILMPNQKAIYKEDERQFSTTLVSNPLPVMQDSISRIKPENFVFEETKLSTVLSSLEKTYGIEIVVENENIYQCLFTGNLARQTLYNKLDIICQSVKVSYEINGTRILIKGKGCN